MDTGLIAVTSDGIACLYRIIVVYARLDHGSAVLGTVRVDDVESGVPFVGDARFPILKHFGPKGGLRIIGNHGIPVRGKDGCGQDVHAHHPGLLAVGIQTLDFGTGRDDGIDAVAVTEAVGLVGKVTARQLTVQIPFHGRILSGILHARNHPGGVEQHFGEHTNRIAGEHVHVHAQGLGRFYGQDKIRRTDGILHVVERARHDARIHIGLRPDILVDARIGYDNAVGARIARNHDVAPVPIVTDGRIGNIAAAVQQMSTYHEITTLTLEAVGGKLEEHRRITLRTLHRQRVANHLQAIALGLAAHFVDQGIVETGETYPAGIERAVGGNDFSVQIPLVAYRGGDGAGRADDFDILQFDIAHGIDRRSGTMHGNLGIEILLGRAFLDATYQYFVLVVIDIATLTDNEQYVAFRVFASCPDMVAALIDHQGGPVVLPAQVERIVGIVTAPVVPPTAAAVMNATLVVDTHHRGTFLAADDVTEHEVSMQYGRRSKIGPGVALRAIFHDLTTQQGNHRVGSEIPVRDSHLGTEAGIGLLPSLGPKRIGLDDVEIGRVAGHATMTSVGFHHEIRGQSGHLHDNRIGVEAERCMIDVNGFMNGIGLGTHVFDNRLLIAVAHRPLVTDIRVLNGQRTQYQVMSDTERIGQRRKRGGIDDAQGVEAAQHIFHDQTLVKAHYPYLIPVVMGDVAGIGNRIRLVLTALAHRIGAYLAAVTVKHGRGVAVPPFAGKNELRVFTFANRAANQFHVHGKFLLDIADMYRIVGMAALGRHHVHVIGKEARVGTVEYLERTVRVAVSVAQARGRRPGITVRLLVCLVVGGILDGQVVTDADFERVVGHIDVRQRINVKFQRIHRVAGTELVGHDSHQQTAFLGNEPDGVLINGRQYGKCRVVLDERPFRMIELVGKTIGISSLGHAEIEAVAMAGLLVGTQLRIRQIKDNHHDTLEVGTSVGIDARHTVGRGKVGPYEDTAVVDGSRIHVERQFPCIGGGSGSGDTNRIATAYVSRIIQTEEIARIGRQYRDGIGLGHRTFHAHVVALDQKRHDVIGFKAILMVVEAVFPVAEFERGAVHHPVIIGLFDRRSEHGGTEHDAGTAILDKGTHVREMRVVGVRATGMANGIQRETAIVETCRVTDGGGMEHASVAQVADHAVGDLDSVFLDRVVTAERALVNAVFINLDRAPVKVDGVIDVGIMFHFLARSETEHLVETCRARIGAHPAVALDGLLGNGTRVPVTVVTVVGNDIAAHAKRTVDMRKGHGLYLERIACLQHILVYRDAERRARLDENDGVVLIDVRRYGASVLGLQLGRHDIALVGRVLLGDEVAISQLEIVDRTHFHTVQHPHEAVIGALVGDACLEQHVGKFADGISATFDAGIQTNDIHRRLPQLVVGERKRVASLGRILDTTVIGHIEAVDLVAGGEGGHQGVARIDTNELVAVGILHVPLEHTRVVSRRMRLEDNQFLVRTYRSALVAVDGHERFGHLGILDLELLALYRAFKHATARRFHFDVNGRMVDHIGIMVGEDAVVADRFAVEVPSVPGFVAGPLGSVPEEVFLLLAFDDMRRVGSQHGAVVNDIHRRLLVFLYKHLDGVGERAETRCRSLDRADVIGKRILGLYFLESIHGKGTAQGGRRGGILHGHFPPTIRHTLGGTYGHCLDGQETAIANRRVGRTVYERFGREGHAVDARTTMPVHSLHVIGGDLRRTHLDHRILIYERTRMEHGQARVTLAQIRPTIEIGTVGQQRHGVATTENKIVGRTGDEHLRNINDRLDGLAERDTGNHATDARHQTALHAVARFKIAYVQRLVVLGCERQRILAVHDGQLELHAVHIPYV